MTVTRIKATDHAYVCPHCQRPIPDASVVKAAASINARKNAGKGARPGAKGLVRNPAGRPKKKAQKEM